MRLALLQESREALAKVRRGANASVLVNSRLQFVVKLLLAEVSEQALGAPETGRTGFEQRSRQLARARHQPLLRHDLIDQAHLPRLFCVKEAPTQQQVAGALLADLADQEDRNQRRYKADAGSRCSRILPREQRACSRRLWRSRSRRRPPAHSPPQSQVWK